MKRRDALKTGAIGIASLLTGLPVLDLKNMGKPDYFLQLKSDSTNQLYWDVYSLEPGVYRRIKSSVDSAMREHQSLQACTHIAGQFKVLHPICFIAESPEIAIPKLALKLEEIHRKYGIIGHLKCGYAIGVWLGQYDLSPKKFMAGSYVFLEKEPPKTDSLFDTVNPIGVDDV